MPAYVWFCREDGTRVETFRSIHAPGNPPAPQCAACSSDMVRDYSSTQISANPVAWREENRLDKFDSLEQTRQDRNHYEKSWEPVTQNEPDGIEIVGCPGGACSR